MTTLGTLPNLLDHAKVMDPDGSIATIAELLHQKNEAVIDAVWFEGNLENGHQSTVRTGLPTAYWTMANQGTAISKATTAQIIDLAGYLSARGQIDVRVARLNGNNARFRATQNVAHIESMGQALATAMFYGNSSVDPEQFMGLAPRYSSLSAENADNIVDGLGESTDNTSIWFIVWGENTISMRYPKGQMAGLKHMDIGEDDVLDGDGNPYRALKDLFEMNAGMTVTDWRYAARICNIDVSNLVAGASALDLLDAMISAYSRLQDLTSGRAAIYCNRTIKTMLWKQARDKNNVYLTIGEEEGRPKVSFMGIPIRTADVLHELEARVT
jgi:hypothetical protein